MEGKMAEGDDTTELFWAHLEVSGSTARTTLKPLQIKLEKGSGKNKDAKKIPYTMQDKAVPSEAKVWLQVWDIQTYEGDAKHRAEVLKKKKKNETPTNSLLVELPGYIQQTDRNKFEFRVLGAPTFGSGDALGWLTLLLQNRDGKPWKKGEKDLVVPFIGDSDDEIDLGCSLETSAGTKSHGSEWKTNPYHVVNLTHILLAMQEEDGLTMGLYADLNSPDALKDRANWWKNGHPPLGPDPHNSGPVGEITNRYIGDIINDDEFPGAGENFARRFHSVGLDPKGELTLGSTPFKGEGDIFSTVQKVCDKVEEEFLKPLGKPRLKVRRLAFFTHGSTQDSSGLLMGKSAKGAASGKHPHKCGESWIGKPALPRWVDNLAKNLHDEVVIALMACLAGQGNDAFGELPKASYVGESSFAAALCKALHEQGGLKNPAVWAHTTEGHTYGNAHLRAFTKDNGADLVWMVPGNTPTGDTKHRRETVSKWLGKRSVEKKSAEVCAKMWNEHLHAALCHPGTQVAQAGGGASGGGASGGGASEGGGASGGGASSAEGVSNG
jgi:hypothetical protein